MKRHICLAAILVAVLQTPFADAQNASRRIGVWNIEKLSSTASRGFPEASGIPPRTDQQLQEMAEYIRDEVGVDAMMVTEVAADDPASTDSRPQSAQLNRVSSLLGPQWRYFLGRTGDRLRVGLLFNSDTIRLKKLVNLHASEFRVSGQDVLDRDPFIAWIDFLEDGERRNDVLLIGLHLKSQQQPFRDNRMAAVAKIIGDLASRDVREALSLPNRNEEAEVIIMGDCNDSSFRGNGFHFMFDYLEGRGFRHVREGTTDAEYPHTRVNGSQIDHMFATRAVTNGLMIDGSFHVHTVPDTPAERTAYRHTLSDHFPVTLDLRIEPDSDFTVMETLALDDPAERAERLSAMAEEMRVEATAAAEDASLLDDEPDRDFHIDAEVMNGGFERILAPAPALNPSTPWREDPPGDDLLQPGIPGRPGGLDADLDPSSSARAAPLLQALMGVQRELNSTLPQRGELSEDQTERLRRLLQVQQQLLELMSERR